MASSVAAPVADDYPSSDGKPVAASDLQLTPRPSARAIVADDLTGAMDSGVQVLAGAPVTVVVSPAGADPPAAGTVLVVNTQSRGVAPSAAAARVGAAGARLRGEGRTVWFKKLDSTMRGNVGAELAALHAALAPCTIVCTPALPAQGRTVVAGELRVQGQPVMSTPYRDEIAPAAGRAAGSAVIDIVRRQWPACRALRLAAPADDRQFAAALQAAVDLVVADAAGDGHLRHLAAAGRLAARGGRRLLWAGSAGLLRALAPDMAAPAAAGGLAAVAAGGGRQELPAARPLLLIAGSRRTLAHAQLRGAAAAVPAHLALRLEPPAGGGAGGALADHRLRPECRRRPRHRRDRGGADHRRRVRSVAVGGSAGERDGRPFGGGVRGAGGPRR